MCHRYLCLEQWCLARTCPRLWPCPWCSCCIMASAMASLCDFLQQISWNVCTLKTVNHFMRRLTCWTLWDKWRRQTDRHWWWLYCESCRSVCVCVCVCVCRSRSRSTRIQEFLNRFLDKLCLEQCGMARGKSIKNDPNLSDKLPCCHVLQAGARFTKYLKIILR